MSKVIIIGGGLAGTEAAYFLANKGIKVTLYEMKKVKLSEAHHSTSLSELVCTNSLKSKEITNAAGLLKKEMELFSSLMMQSASANEVPGGNALCVDRDGFATYVTRIIHNHPLIEVIDEEVTEIPKADIVLITTGPLTSEPLTSALGKKIGSNFLSFFDASAPIVLKDSINMDIAYFKSRYEQGDNAYLNLPFTKEQYDLFYNELVNATRAPLSEMDTKYFDACMPIEIMAKKGYDTMRYGPLKPRGLRRDENHKPFAVLQLRQDDVMATLFNIVGFQTNLTYPEQRRVFRLIPGLENAEFVRYGLMHRNTYVNAPRVLNKDMSLKVDNNIYLAGQLSGVEGYVESAASGLYAAIAIWKRLTNNNTEFPLETMLGRLMHYIVHANPEGFAPMNANFGIVPGATKHNRETIANEYLSNMKAFRDLLNE